MIKGASRDTAQRDKRGGDGVIQYAAHATQTFEHLPSSSLERAHADRNLVCGQSRGMEMTHTVTGHSQQHSIGVVECPMIGDIILLSHIQLPHTHAATERRAKCNFKI